MKRYLFTIIILIFICLPHFSKAQDILGESQTFNVETSYDISKRNQVEAKLIKISSQLYWYIDEDWWTNLTVLEQENTRQSLNSLTEEFEDRIYPILTRTFGSEWNPGIDKDARITILVHSMKEGTGGYSDTADEYPKAQTPESNEREMVYLSHQYINNINLAKVFLAHEFTHLIIFNQKERTYSVTEDIWLNEARAEHSATLLGYNLEYEGSNLRRRVKDFLDRPSDSLTEWKNTSADYGVVNLFIQYLVDHYGIRILIDSLQMRETGIESLNAVLSQRGFKTDFSQVFTDWTIATLINDCQISEKYCYLSENLKNFRVTPLINYLPFIGESTLSVTNATKDWSGNWHKFAGGKGELRFEFRGSSQANFKVPYVIQDSEGNLSISNLAFDENYKGEIIITDFGSQNTSLTIIPLAQNKISNFSEFEPPYSFFWLASTQEEFSPSPQKPVSKMTRGEILTKIAEIQALLVKLQAQLAELLGSSSSCQRLDQNLYFGMQNNYQVRCLQEFLKSQGSAIYPEGLVTGNFFNLTQQAVIRFQEKYAADILALLGLTEGTGYVGSSTRAKINELLVP